MHLVVLTIEIYYDARPCVREILSDIVYQILNFNLGLIINNKYTRYIYVSSVGRDINSIQNKGNACV